MARLTPRLLAPDRRRDCRPRSIGTLLAKQRDYDEYLALMHRLREEAAKKRSVWERLRRAMQPGCVTGNDDRPFGRMSDLSVSQRTVRSVQLH
jgi:hypothetical protein